MVCSGCTCFLSPPCSHCTEDHDNVDNHPTCDHCEKVLYGDEIENLKHQINCFVLV